jgi:hypothetical protein
LILAKPNEMMFPQLFLSNTNYKTNLVTSKVDPESFRPQSFLFRGSSASRLLYFRIVLAVLQIAIMTSAYAQGERVHWKPVNLAQIKLDDKTPLAFNVYRPDKKKESHLVLILLGRRYIELDIKAKLAYSVPFTDVHKTASDLESDNFAVSRRVLATSDWSVRDVGPAELIKLTLGDYGRILTVELPHPPDMRAFY